jgi:hypothetical protein
VVTACGKKSAGCLEEHRACGIAKNMFSNETRRPMIPNKKQPFLKDGRWLEFNKHAVLIAEGNYISGKKEGVWREYYDSGELMIEEHYCKGVMHGRFCSFHKNGKVLSEGMFVHGSREGVFRVYDETGKHIKSLCFVQNVLTEEIEETASPLLWLPDVL